MTKSAFTDSSTNPFETFFSRKLPGLEGQASEWAATLSALPVEAQTTLFRETSAALARSSQESAAFFKDLSAAATPAEILARTNSFLQQAARANIESGQQILSAIWKRTAPAPEKNAD